MGDKPHEDYTIERIDVNKSYYKENCEWIPSKDQYKNTRNTVQIEYNGESKVAFEWADIYNIPRGTLYGRIRRGIKPPRLFNRYLR